MNFKLVTSLSLAGVIDALQAASPDAIIDIHIERGECEVKARPSGYVRVPIAGLYGKSPNTAMREFCESEADGVQMTPRDQARENAAYHAGNENAQHCTGDCVLCEDLRLKSIADEHKRRYGLGHMGRC